MFNLNNRIMNKKKLLARTLISVLACTAAACSNDLEQKEIPNQGEGEQITVIATAGMPQDQPSTRLGFDETTNPSKLTITWEATGETFSVLAGTVSATPSTFTQQSVDPSDAHNASFEGKITPAAGTTYYAVYPALSASSADATSIALDMTNQTGTEYDESKVYMYGSSTYTAGVALDFTFRHMTAILKVTMNFPAEAGSTLPDMDITTLPTTRSLSGATMSNVSFSATSGLYTSADANITEAAVTYSNQATGRLTLSGTFPLSDDAKPSATVYLHVLPGELSNFKVRATVGGEEYIGTITASATLETGKLYTNTVEMEIAN